MLGELGPRSWKAWVQVRALPPAGHVMPGMSHYLSGGQGDQNQCISTEVFCHRAGGHPNRQDSPAPSPHRKLPGWTIIFGASPHRASVSMRKTLMCVHSFPADLSPSPV